MSEHTVTIAWTLSEPPVPPRAWKIWPPLLAGQPEDASLEEDLTWPAGTLAALRQAFDMRLGRGTGWESEAAAVQAAARVYKRGVASREPGVLFAPSERRGRYQLKIWSSNQPPAALTRTSVFSIVDGNVAAAWPNWPFDKQTFILTLDEHSKTLDSVAKIIAAAREAGAPRAWRVVGGGLLTDVAAFAAGLVGVAIEFVPTTLLAIADACIGGKTGVNFPPYGKNQLGLFHFPSGVQVWTGWLRTLPERELMAGGSECLKHAILSGDMRLARSLATALNSQDEPTLTSLLPAVVGFKAQVVAEDPGENGRRAILNFGHTMGHALEGIAQSRTAADTTLRHGEAVALGMLFAILLSQRVGELSASATGELVGILKQSGCLLTLEALEERMGVEFDDEHSEELLNELKRLIGHDKKNAVSSDTTAEWVLLAAPGKVQQEGPGHWTVSVFMAELTNVWREFLHVLRQGDQPYAPPRR